MGGGRSCPPVGLTSSHNPGYHPNSSYARKLVTVTSGGVLDWLDPVLERYSFDELGEVA